MGKTPKEIAEKWARRAAAATEDYKKGIDRVTESPTAKAAAKKEKMKANLLKALDEGKWEKGLLAVSLDEWKRKAKEKGGANYGTGIRAAEGDMAEFMSEVMPHIESGKAMIEKMNSSIRIKNKEMAIKIAIGKENMSDEDLAENIEVAIKELGKKLPRGRDNIKEVLIKFTMTKPTVIMEVRK